MLAGQESDVQLDPELPGQERERAVADPEGQRHLRDYPAPAMSFTEAEHPAPSLNSRGMNMKTLVTIGIAVATVGTFALAQMMTGGSGTPMNMPGMNHGNMTTQGNAGGMMGGMSGMSEMMGGMNAQNIDRNFITMMISSPCPVYLLDKYSKGSTA